MSDEVPAMPLPDTERLASFVDDVIEEFGSSDAAAIANELLRRLEVVPEPRRASPRRFAPHRRRFRPVHDDGQM